MRDRVSMPPRLTTAVGPRAVSEMIVLAGGFGSRLRAVVSEVPKPMAPVGDRPFLEYFLEYWLRQGIARFVISTGYLAEVIEHHFGGAYLGAAIEYVREDQPLGTGGAIRACLQTSSWRNAHILIANGDTWFEADLAQLQAAAPELPVVIAAKRLPLNDRYGGMDVDDSGRVRAFGVEAPTDAVINAGTYLADRRALEAVLAGGPAQFSLERETLPALASAGKLGASVQEGVFLDIGIPSDLARAAELIPARCAAWSPGLPQHA